MEISLSYSRRLREGVEELKKGQKEVR